jgi:hypothetical protein
VVGVDAVSGGLAALGPVVQRTRIDESELDIQRGFRIGLSYKRVELTAHLFNPDKNKPTYVMAVSVGF